MTYGDQQPGKPPELPQSSEAVTPAPPSSPAEGKGGNPEADLRLVQAALAGQESALEQLANRLGCIPRLVASRLRRYGAKGHIEVPDLSQEVFARIWPRMGTFRGEGTLEGWIWGFVVRVVYSAMTQSTQGRDDAYDLDQLPAVSKESASDPVATAVDCLSRLSERDQEIVSLRAMEKLDYQEIARKLSCTERAAKGRYHRAMARLRALLDQDAQAAWRPASPLP